MSDFTKYDIIHIGISGGKDSQGAATYLVEDSGCPIDKIRLSFCDTGNEHEYTYQHIDRMENWLGLPIERLKPELDFYQLAKKKGRFPSPKARFCTEYLKMNVSQAHILSWMREEKRVLLVTGVRHQESIARAELKEFDFDTFYACDIYRPLIDWTTMQVFDYLKSKGQYANPLYALGARRVGCFPCMMSRKHEIRLISDLFPERITMIREAELNTGEGGGSFFAATTVPEKFRRKEFTKNGKKWQVASIDDVVDWSHTAHGGKEYDSGPQPSLFEDEPPTCINNSGACE